MRGIRQCQDNSLLQFVFIRMGINIEFEKPERETIKVGCFHLLAHLGTMSRQSAREAVPL